MRKLNTILISAALVLGATASADAFAQRGNHHRHHHRAHVGFFIGAPLVFAPWYYHHYYPPVYYPAPAAVYPSAPPVYIEQGQEAAPPRSDASWYYCPGAKAYYPYVAQCAGGWQRVSPQPPPS